MLHRDLDRCVPGKGNLTGEQLVEHHADGVEIGGLVDRGAPRLLRRQVLRGADDRARFSHLAHARARNAEIGHLQSPLAVDQHVVRLDVAVDDAVAVSEPDRGEDLPRVVDREVDRRRPACDDELLQGTAVEVLHRDVVRAFRLAAVIDRDDVRMRKAGRVLRLTAEALDELFVTGVAIVQDLDRDTPAEHLVLGEVDVRHPTRAELAQDAVAPVEERVDQSVGDCHWGFSG